MKRKIEAKADVNWWERQPPLGRFILDHLQPAKVDELLSKIDTHPSHGRGEKSRA